VEWDGRMTLNVNKLICARRKYKVEAKSEVGVEVITAVVMKSAIFRDIQPVIRSKSTDLPPTFTLLSCSEYSWNLKMEAICSSEMSVGFQRTTRCYIPEDNAREKLRFLLAKLRITVRRGKAEQRYNSMYF
jgi:hypothetical protein